jgi:hypothetical protein
MEPVGTQERTELLNRIDKVIPETPLDDPINSKHRLLHKRFFEQYKPTCRVYSEIIADELCVLEQELIETGMSIKSASGQIWENLDRNIQLVDRMLNKGECLPQRLDHNSRIQKSTKRVVPKMICVNTF